MRIPKDNERASLELVIAETTSVMMFASFNYFVIRGSNAEEHKAITSFYWRWGWIIMGGEKKINKKGKKMQEKHQVNK